MSLSIEHHRVLLHAARESVSFGMKTGRPAVVDASLYDEPMREHRATFITWKRFGELRGCIGGLEATRPLIEDVVLHAFAAAFNDPRFPPVAVHELLDLRASISILSPHEVMTFKDEDDLLAQIRPGVDGLLLEDPAINARGTFLPVVWESIPDPRAFMMHLRRKSGLPDDYWSDTLRLSRYTTEIIEDDA